METIFFIFLALVVNTVCASHIPDWTDNTYIRRLSIFPPFGFIILILICIISMSFIFIQIIKELWN